MQYLLLVSLIWAFSFGLIKGQLTTLDPHFVAWSRMAIAMPLFLPFLRLSKLSGKQMLWLLSIGGIQYGLMYVFFIRSFQYLQAHQIVLFTTTTPIYVTLISDAFRKSFRPYYLFTAFIALLGAAIISFKTSTFEDILIGVLYIEASGLAFAFGQVAYKYFRKEASDLDDLNIYALLYMGAFMVTAIATHITHGWDNFSIVTEKQVYTLLYLGAIASGLCFYWWNKGAVRTHSGTLAAFNNLKIPLGVAVSLLVFGETAHIGKLALGLGLVLLSLWLAEKRARS